MATFLNTAPVAAQAYGWQSGDSIAASGTSDAGSEFALSNIIDPVHGPHTFRGGRTTTKNDAEGFTFGLTATIELSCMELLNTAAVASEDITWAIDNATTFVAADQISTAAWPQLPADVWTGFSGLMRSKPVRSNILLGYDNFATGPTPAPTPTVATRTCGSGKILFSTAGSGRTYWEASYLALGIEARTLPELTTEPGKIDVVPVKLRSPAGGMGYKYTITWEFLPNADLVYLDGLWESTGGEGEFPVFLFPVPGQRTVTTGVISGTDYSPQLRGGLMRFLSWKRKETRKLPSGAHGEGGRIVAETWQEIPA